jgi:hypothetical protein
VISAAVDAERMRSNNAGRRVAHSGPSNGRQKREPNVRGFVHNPDVDVKALFDEAQEIIEASKCF